MILQLCNKLNTWKVTYLALEKTSSTVFNTKLQRFFFTDPYKGASFLTFDIFDYGVPLLTDK